MATAAGPIERAHHMLPQFGTKRTFNEAMAYDGVRQMLWGLFKKVVVADNCAAIVNPIFADHATQDGSTLALNAAHGALTFVVLLTLHDALIARVLLGRGLAVEVGLANAGLLA